MKKLIFLIPFMLVLSSCGDDNSSTPSNINSDQTSSQATAGIGGGDITPNPDGDNSGSTGGSTTNPADPVNTGSDDTGTSTDPVNPGSDESGTSTDPVNPGSDDTGTSTDPVNPGSDDTGTSTDPVNPGSDESGSGIVDVVVNPGGGNESGSEIVDIVVVPGGGDESGSEIVDIVVVPGGNEEDKEAPKYTDTIFDYINRDNLYYRSTLSASEKAVYDRLYDTFKSFYGRNTVPVEVEPCTDGVLCGATDGFIETADPDPDKYNCIDDMETGNWNGVCAFTSWKEQYKRWAQEYCINTETGEPRLNVVFEGALFGKPVCGEDNYNYKYGEWLYKNTVGVPVSLLNVQNGLTNSALKSIEEKLMLDLSNLYLFKAGGQVSNTKYDILNYYKIQPVSSFSSDSAVKEQWASQMKQIQEKVYRAIWDYTDGKIDKFEDLLNRYLWALIDNFVVYDANGASDITGAITGSFNAKGLARLFAFACQISSDYQCAYVEGKANYSTGFGNHGGEEFDHAWVIVKNSKLCSNNEDALIDPLRLNGLRLADTWPYRCVSSPENAGYKPNIK